MAIVHPNHPLCSRPQQGRRHRNLKKIAAFFGNKVPLNLARQFFAACSYLPLSLVRHRFQYRYDLFTHHPLQSRYPYYDLREGLYRYTDGSDSEDPLQTTLDFGGMGFLLLAQSILLEVNQLEYVEHAVY